MNYGNLAFFKDLLAYMWPYRKKFFLGTLFRLFSDLLWLFPPWALSEIINFATTYQKGDSLQYFWTLTLIVWAFGILHYVTHDYAKYLIFPIAEAMRLDAYQKAIQHMFQLSSDWHEKENSGNKLQRISKAGESLDQTVRLWVDLIIESTVNIVGVTIVLATLGWEVNLIMIVFFLVYFILSRILTHKASQYSLKTNIEWENFEGVVFESINNIATIKALGLWRPILSWLKKNATRLHESIRHRVFWYRTRSGLLNLVREFARQTLLLFVALQIFNGQMEVGVIALIMFYFLKISSSAEEFAEVAYRFELNRIAMMRMSQILNTAAESESSGKENFPRNWKELKVENLHFAYEDYPVLQGIHFKLKRGKKIGIVGLSGAGKSTLFKLLLKLYDRYEGSIAFDGRELKSIKRKYYLEHFSYVPQETELFNLSLKQNITMAMDNKVNEKRFQHALEVAQVDDFLQKLPNGVETLVGEKGVKLSGGEKQRVGIARAIYQKPELLFLDEATSHLDADSEDKIQKALHKVFQEVTALVIAHRLSTLKEMDEILVIHEGKIAESGRFDELIKAKGVFSDLWEKQSF